MEYPRLNHAGAARRSDGDDGHVRVRGAGAPEAANRGIADLPLALVPHPLGGIHEDEVIRKADLALESVLKALTRA